MTDMPHSRRGFLKAAAGVATGVLTAGPLFATRAQARLDDPRVVVLLVLRGGLDGLSVVVPYRQSSYYARRPSIAIAPPGQSHDAAIDLDGRHGLHPALAPLLPYYRAGELCPVLGVGPVARCHSHLAAEQALLDAVTTATGEHCAMEIVSEPADWSCRQMVTTSYPEGLLCQQLAQVASAVQRRDLALAVVTCSGFDTHFAQGGADGRLGQNLAQLASALDGFQQQLGARAADVITIATSEFGRGIGENPTGGTEDGWATAALVLGKTVAGGRVLGSWNTTGEERALEVAIPFPALVHEVTATPLISATSASFSASLGLLSTGPSRRGI